MKKKILLSILSVFMLFGLVGCSSSKTPEEVEKILTNNEYKESVNVIFDNSSTICNANEDNFAHGWAYNEPKDILAYISYEDNNEIILTDLDKSIAYTNFVTFEENKSVNQETIKKLIEESNQKLKDLNLTSNDIKNYLKNKIKIEADEYKKLSTKEKLIYHFESYKDEINKLNESDIEKMYKSYIDDTDSTFSELYEELILNNGSVPEKVIATIKNLKSKKSNAKMNWDMSNFSFKEIDGTSYISYDWYLDYRDTNIDFLFMYKTSSKKFEAINLYCKDANFKNVDEAEDILIMFMLIMQSFDSSIDATQAFNIANNCYNKIKIYNNYGYNITLDPDLSMMIFSK